VLLRDDKEEEHTTLSSILHISMVIASIATIASASIIADFAHTDVLSYNYLGFCYPLYTSIACTTTNSSTCYS
jgi:hypothetical protein